MAVYFANTEITGIKDLFPLSSKDITGLYFGDTELFTVWGEYDGTLPAQYSANGSTLADYQIYGSAGGVGDRTINLFNYLDTDGRTNNKYINQIDGAEKTDSAYYISGFIPVQSNAVYTWAFRVGTGVAHGSPTVGFYDSGKNKISVASHATPVISFNFTTPQNCVYIRASVYKVNEKLAMLTEGSTAPAEYIPYGYEVDMGVRSANLFDKNAYVSGLAYNRAKDASGTVIVSDGHCYSENITPVRSSTTYTICGLLSSTKQSRIYFFNSGMWISRSDQFINNTPQAFYTFTTPSNCDGIQILAGTDATPYATVMLVSGSTIPTSYIPYSCTDIPIYVGSDPLGEDEYVDYGMGKIYRRSTLYDANATDTSKGYLSESYLYGNTIGSNPNWFVSEYMPILAGTDYIASGLVDVGALGVIATINIYNSNKQLERYETINSSGNTEINSGVNGAFIRISARNEHKNTVVVKSKNATPTDPPAPLPALPTVDGTTITDYAGQSAAVPSRFVAKYRKEGFK